MTESLATTEPILDSSLALLGGSGLTGDENYVPSCAYFTTGWRKSGDDVQNALKSAGLDCSGNQIHFGINKGGLYEWIAPFNFFLIRSKEVFSLGDDSGKSIRYRAKVLPDDPEKENYRDGFITQIVVLQGGVLIPAVSTVGRFQGGLGRAIKTARLAAQNYAIPPEKLASKGPAYATSAKCPSIPFRCLFTLSATIEKNDKGQLWIKGNVTQRPITSDDLEVLSANDIVNTSSPFFKDFAETAKVYDRLAAQIDEGWDAKEEE